MPRMRSAAGYRRAALTAVGALAFVVVYLVVAAVATDFAEFMGISPWWLPSALKFALLVRLGWRWAPVSLVAELSNAVIIYDEAIDPQIILQSALITGSYLAAALVMKRVCRVDLALRRPRDVLWLLVCGAGIGAGGSASVGVGGMLLAQSMTMAEAPLGFLTWWAGDAVAVVVLGVPLILLRRPKVVWPGRTGAVEAAALLVLVVVTPIVAVQVAGQRSYLFLCFIPLVWAALRWGIAVTAYTALAMSVLTTYSVGHALDAGVRLADLQVFMGTLCATALLLGSVVSQLHELNSDLESRVRDRTAELKAVNEQLAHEATHDRLTGLANRALFDDRLQNALDRRRRAPATMVVALLDLDGFKRVNDGYGHESGDRVLSEVALRLSNCVRTEDTVARLGGDEFAVLLDAGVTQEALFAVTERILAALAEPIAIGETTLVVGASIGAAVTDGGVDPGTVLREADRQMYEVKRHGKGYLAMTDLVPA